MYQYLLRRLLIAVPTVLGISAALFSILALAPGDPFEELALNPDIPVEVRLHLRQQFGLDDPLPLRYLRWLTAMLQGEWGYSFASRVDVLALVWQRLPTTLFVLGSAYGLALCIALPVGVISAVKPYSIFDHLATTFAFVGHSLPTFFTGLLFILLFSLHLEWLPFIYSTTIEAEGLTWIIEHLRQAAMPIAVLGLFESATLTRFIRAAMLDVIHQDFVTTARSKGLPERRTILGHVLRNALIPVVTVVALQVPGIFTGAVITEQIFRVPGIGSLLIAAIQSSDTPVVMAITFVYSILVVVFNVIADIVYGLLDPRITYA
ncbi:MAG TPA: ABC transporter permease [Candidatus Tectomicrobia bacterium]|nr:ABC transporter permease [Candidatus Tectomicrobia bacterium]